MSKDQQSDTIGNINSSNASFEANRPATEATPLLDDARDQNRARDHEGDEGEGESAVNKWRFVPSWVKRDFGYGVLLGIPVILFIPSLVFFIMTLNLRGNLPPSSSLETITNLTHQVSRLSRSLSTCTDNTTRLATELQDERSRVDICRESEKRLAERVDLVEGMLDTCQKDALTLKGKLNDVTHDLGTCVDEKEELKRQMESGVYVQFLDMVKKMGTGGDSWVCSDTTELWSYGYTHQESPHPTINIQTWTSELTDAQHSTSPLVFPPVSMRHNSRRGSSEQPPPEQIYNAASRIVGYTVSSGNLSGNNGWWRITKLPSFAVKGGTIEFFAQAAKWYGSAAKYQVTVFWVGSQ